MNNRTKMLFMITAIAVLVFLSVSAAADPTGTSLINGTDARRTNYIDTTTGNPVEADAGNLTSLFINSTQVSKRWQGYYGNVTGEITLDDANQKTMYNWLLLNPSGEIYAVNGSTTPAWSTVECLQFNRSVTETDLTDLQNNLGMDVDDIDNVNNTFNLTYAGSFNVGSSNTINSEDNCSMVSLFVDDGYNEVNFNETILMDDTNDNNLVIYTAIIEQSLTGFQGTPLDFQMIVGENGDAVASTTYWFYVELT